ncbi:hypothetical protein [Sphingobacterium sp. UGAL515B_05]|uniref:hypothetical protein n=1 Tax=Sphingobacterium sp. UGAL515B_05 TaxID=2986767 RepID=UPI002954CA91|nr:hypothetical protein [Sphingobacterium sp. UGAL515B_05]WON93882.1 hypothetical protein OK025_21855 [Sphingobacterium sp. UGAL515B_05]
MEILELSYKGKDLQIPFEVDPDSQGKNIQDYKLFGKNGQTYIVRQDFMKWNLIKGKLPIDLSNAIIDQLVLKYEKHLLALCYYGDERQILSISNLEFMGHDYAYHLMLNRSDLGYLTWSAAYGWKIDTRLKFKGQWITMAELDIIIDSIEKGEIPWLKRLPQAQAINSPLTPS